MAFSPSMVPPSQIVGGPIGFAIRSLWRPAVDCLSLVGSFQLELPGPRRFRSGHNFNVASAQAAGELPVKAPKSQHK